MKKLSVEFFEVKKVLNEKVLLKFFQENDIYFSYFQVKKNMYYLFLYYDNNESALSLPDNVCIVNILAAAPTNAIELSGSAPGLSAGKGLGKTDQQMYRVFLLSCS